ncbi:MAG: GGDEF domain-containing protein, partial [Burkholderiales bacterium]
VFAIATLSAAAILLSAAAVPQWLAKQARWEVLREHVGQIGQLAASVVDGDLHRQLLDPANYTAELYARAVAPLVRFHSANSDLFYVYTMAVRDEVPHFILDTATSPKLRTKYHLRASPYMQSFKLRQEYQDGWLDQIAAGKTYVTPTYERDDYGDFLTAHVPIYDGEGRYSGFVGVDFDMQYYLSEEVRFRVIEAGSLAVATLAAVLIGLLVALYHRDLKERMRALYHKATHDELTNLLNRRGAKLAINKDLTSETSSCAMLLIGIDHFEMIIDTYGRSTAEAVAIRTAEAIRCSTDDGEICARLEPAEFMVFCLKGDVSCARNIAERISNALSSHRMNLAGLRATVTIGIVTEGANPNFSRMCSEARAMIYETRREGLGGTGLAVQNHSLGTALPPT